VRRRVALPAAALSLLVVLTGCIPDAPTPPPTPDRSGAGSDWEDCYTEARESNPGLSRDKTVECTTVTVPADWNDPNNGKTIDIAVMRIYTGDLEDKQGSVLTNPGGPGGSGLDFLPSFVEPSGGSGLAPDALLDEFALVSFDPRGVGKSEPVDCISDADLDAQYGYDPDPISDEAFNGLVELNQRIADGCDAKYGDDLKLFSTVQAAKDMDAIRAAVGDEQLTYLGFSYGTLLGAVYAQLFPDHVRALVLDGAVNPLADPIESSEGQAMGFERALSNFSDWCQQNQAQCPISSNPRGAIAAEIERGRVSPVAGPDGRQATSGWVLWGVTLAMYSQTFWQYLGPAIDDLSRGDANLIFALADTYADRDEQGNYTNQTDAFNAIGCVDSEQPGEEEIRELQSQWRDKYPIFGAMLATGLLPCSTWPGEKDPYPTGAYTGETPVVVVGTLGDPATPYESTQKLADMLGNGVVVTWEGEGHTAYGETSCIQRAVDNFLIDLVVPDDGMRCPAS
jgi:pimeloyl-ACP methyl ester carboxylesterase